MLDVLLRVGVGEGAVVADDRGPRPAARIGAERLAFLVDQRDHDRGQAVLLHEGEMLGEALVAVDAVLGAAHRPVQHHAQRRLRMRHAERHHRAAAHAAAHEVRALDAEMIEQALALRDVVRPGDALDAAARLAALAPVERRCRCISSAGGRAA